MSQVMDPNGYVFPSIAVARWHAFFVRLLGQKNVRWAPQGYDGLPAGLAVTYPYEDRKLYGVVSELDEIPADQWRNFLERGETPTPELIILDGMPSARMYLSPSEVFFTPYQMTHGVDPAQLEQTWIAGDTPLASAERLEFKPPPEAYFFDRTGSALYSYKCRTWVDTYAVFFEFDDPNNDLGQASIIAAVHYALSIPLRRRNAGGLRNA